MSKKIYEPYLNLLCAICNSDDDETYRNSCIVVYDTFENERLIAIFTKAKYCAKFFNTNEKCIADNICRSNLRKCRYKIVRVHFKEEQDEDTIK